MQAACPRFRPSQAAERDYDLNRAAELKYGTLLELQKQLKEAEALLEAETANSVGAACLCPGRKPLSQSRHTGLQSVCAKQLLCGMVAQILGPALLPTPPAVLPARPGGMQGNRMLHSEVTEEDIAEIVSKWTGIPVSSLKAR